MPTTRKHRTDSQQCMSLTACMSEIQTYAAYSACYRSRNVGWVFYIDNIHTHTRIHQLLLLLLLPFKGHFLISLKQPIDPKISYSTSSRKDSPKLLEWILKARCYSHHQYQCKVLILISSLGSCFVQEQKTRCCSLYVGSITVSK